MKKSGSKFDQPSVIELPIKTTLFSSISLINILFDPQTNGPLLMVINEKDKDFFEKDFYKSYKVAPILLGKFTKKKEELIIFN